jgi:putrescine aminotransferase
VDSDSLYADVFQNYTDHINPNLARLMAFAGFGVETSALGAIITDHEGREFIDCLGGYGTFTFGHRHPKIVAAVRDQLDLMGLSGKAFFSKPQADLAAALAKISPSGLEFAFFCNSGAEAVEAALKFAKGATQRAGIISTQGSYHGKTLGALSTTEREKYRKPFMPLLPGVQFAPFGDADAVAALADENTAAIIVEPIQGEGGIIIPPDGYLARLRVIADRCGAVLIFDEVQTGLGRTGRNFACEWDSVAPDIMCLAKALGGGIMPLGAILYTRAIYDQIYDVNPLAHTSTFGGNGLACRAGLAALEVLQDENIAVESEVKGHLMLAGFQEIGAAHPDLVAEVRGRGLMIGLEFSMDEVGELVVAQLLKRGVCVAYALNNPRVLRFEPPVMISPEQIETVRKAVSESIAETAELLAELV